MKKIALTILVCAAICACDKEASVTKDVSQQTFEGGVAYLTVNIKDVNTSTRATNGGFAYGTTAEQAVSNAHFYFYDDNGDYMAQGSVGSVSGAVSIDDATNIEWGSNTVVAVWGLTDYDNLPTKMVTVLNQPANFSGAHKSLTEMTAALSQATGGWNSGSASSPSFVMSTSVYDAGSSGIVNYTALTASDFSLEPIDLSSDYPNGGVEVYVERLAAKVGVSLSTTMYGDASLSTTLDAQTIDGVTYYDVGGIVGSSLQSDLGGDLYLGVLGWDLNGTARDSYMLKNISDDSAWSNLTFVWDDARNYRSHWAESPNYGVSLEYPTSSNGITDTGEDDTPLNEYLRYTSLASPLAFDEYGYCAENTNTVDVLGDALSNGITNVLVKAQAGTITWEAFTPIDLIEYHGGYYTAEDFLNQCVEDVVDYDFTVLVAEVITALEGQYSGFSSYLEELNDAIIHDAVYVSAAVTGHKVTSSNAPTSVSVFDGSLLSLYNLNDGKVDIFFKDAEQYYGEEGDGSQVEPTLCGKYDPDDIVYGDKSMGDYEFYFHVDYDKLSTATQLGASLIDLIVSIDGEYYLPLDNSFYFTTSSTFDDPNWTGNHTYTLRNFFLRAITVEADGIDSEYGFGSYHPNFYKDGLMYYAIPVEHLGSSTTDALVEGQYGIVRNHWYDITINYIASLGYGIADEDEVIVPQPALDYYYLGADVNILSWNMINQSSGLGPRN